MSTLNANERQTAEINSRIVDLAVAHSGRVLALREIDPGRPAVNVVHNWQKLLQRP